MQVRLHADQEKRWKTAVRSNAAGSRMGVLDMVRLGVNPSSFIGRSPHTVDRVSWDLCIWSIDELSVKSLTGHYRLLPKYTCWFWLGPSAPGFLLFVLAIERTPTYYPFSVDDFVHAKGPRRWKYLLLWWVEVSNWTPALATPFGDNWLLLWAEFAASCGCAIWLLLFGKCAATQEPTCPVLALRWWFHHKHQTSSAPLFGLSPRAFRRRKAVEVLM